MEDISRDREKEDRFPEEERKPDRERRIRNETLPIMSYQEYSENIQKDMDIIFNPSFINRDGVKFNHTKKQVKSIRRYLLDKTLSEGIPAKFNSSTSASDVFKNTTLEKDRKSNRPIIYVKYKGRTAFSYNTSRESVGEKLRETNKEAFDELKSDLEREIVEFKNDTFAGQVTERFEQQSGFIDRSEPTPQVWRPTYRDVDDAQKEITGKMKMEFESQKYDLESGLRQEEGRRRRAEENLQRAYQGNKEILQKLNAEIRVKDERIQVLENQLKTQSFSQFDKDSKSREIQELKAEISRLENERDDMRQKIKYLERDLDSQQESIHDLEKQVNEKQRRIEELEKKGVSSSSFQKEIVELKKEKSDLEKQLQAQKQRTKLAQDDRDKWKKHSDKDEASLAASEEKVLSLTKEVDDLKNSIESLRKVNSKKVKEFEDYKVNAERRLDKARKEYIQEKSNLENDNKNTISELESAINILETEKDLSRNEIDNLKSLLESKDITIQALEDESYRLRDLNLSLKSIDKDSKEEYDRKLKEIENQKNKVEQSKNTLEERLRKYIQKAKDKEKENRDLKEEIESYLSQLEELNKKVSQSVDKKVFQANQNEFTKAQKEIEKLNINVLDLQRQKEAVEQREKILENNIEYQQKRIEAKDKENTEYQEKFKVFSREKEEFNRKERIFQQNIRDKQEKLRQRNVTISRQREDLQELRERKERVEYTLTRERFKTQQYDRKVAEYDALKESSQEQIEQGVRDREQLEEELKERQKEIQELQRDRIDPKEHENMVRDNKDLIKTIGLLEQHVRETTKVVNSLQKDLTDIERKYKNAKDSLEYQSQKFQDYKQKVERENQKEIREGLRKIRSNYNKQKTKLEEKLKKERESHKFQLSQRLRPGDIKSVQILLNNLSLDDLDEENYRDAYFKYKTARDNFAKKADDETSSKVQRLMFEELKKLADIRLDSLNMSFNYPAKTEAGKEFIRRTDQTLAGKFYRFRMRVSKYLAGTTLGAGIMGVFYLVYDLLKAPASGARSYATHYGYPIATKIGQAAYNSSRTTKAILIGGTAAFVDKAKKDGFINTLYNWISNAYYGVEYGVNAGARVIEYGINAAETAVKASADVAKYVANNTSTVFLMIISAIGIIITLKYSREK